MKWLKKLALLAFSVLLLIPFSTQGVFANHPATECPTAGTLNTDTSVVISGTTNSNFCIEGASLSVCSQGYSMMNVLSSGFPVQICGALPTVKVTSAGQCLNNAVLQNNHCVPDLNQICSTGTIPSGIQCIAQAMSSMIGGELVKINTISLLVASIGVNPIITGLVGITIAGVTVQAVWFFHKRQKSKN